MPTYEFRCPQGHEFEKLYRTISGAEAQAACPVCGHEAGRVMSATGFAFKGSGFYLTDYGKNAHRDKGTPEQRSGAAGGDGGASSGDKADSQSSAASASGADAAAPTAGKQKSEPTPADSKRTDTKPAVTKPADAKPAETKPAATAPKKSTSE